MPLDLGPRTPLGALIRRQHGIVARRQLLADGASPRQIDHRLKSGHLLRTRHRGVYAVGHYPAGDSARHLAAILAYGPGSTLSHLSAAAQWRLRERPETVQITRSVTKSRDQPGARIHAGALLDTERTVVDGVPVTTVARLLLDIAGVHGRAEVERIYAEADRRGRIQHGQIRELIARSGRRRGVAILRELHARHDPTGRPTRSELERIALDLFEAAGIPPSRTNVIVAGREVDMIWDEQGVMVELDGYRHHSGDARFEADRDRDLDMSAVGFRVLRVTWRMIRESPEAVVVRLRQTLARAQLMAARGEIG